MLSVTTLLGYLSVTFLYCSELGFSSVRLSTAIAICKGLSLYPAAAGDAGLITIYPPTFALTYTPAAFFSTPFAALACATLINLLFTWAPALILLKLLLRPSPAGSTAPSSIWPHSLLLLLLMAWLPTLQTTTSTQSDTIALGYLAGALITLHRPLSLGSQWIAALLLALSITSKQTYLTALPVVALWLGFRDGWRAFWKFSLLAGLVLTAVIALLCWHFGAHTLYFNCIEVPGHHPWQDRATLLGESKTMGLTFDTNQRLQSLAALILLGLQNYGWFLLLAGALAYSVYDTPGASTKPRNDRFFPLLLLLVMMAQLPMALLGYIKVGGAANNFIAPSYLFVILFVSSLALWIARKPSIRQPHLTAALLLLSLLVATQTAFRAVRHTPFEQDKVYHYLLAHPERQSYFPFEPLAHLLAQNRAIPVSSTLWDLDMAGFPASAATCTARLGFTPEEIIMTPSMYGYQNVLDRWPEYRFTSEGPELPPGYNRFAPISR
ncbi:MAG: hypothetical protein B9S32_12600 [Verrucomicrobia bacterium Tous-C9LFEB]|nr:MAG: hypothetical protein B9S32_12600 [Verrucomicrobia bacterium Tous-C9LFEB]